MFAQCGGSPDQCYGTQSYTANPAPINGLYNGGQVVTFCYTMQNYNQCSANWLHTIDLDFGPGWDMTTLTPVSLPMSCDGQGNWGFYMSTTSVNTGQTFGPCFSYDSPSGSPFGVLDGNPGNNFGDNCTSNTWIWCWTIQVASGCNNQSLSVDVKAIGDGTGGSWTFDICPGVPYNICNATCSSCHMHLTNSVVNPTCANNNGSITLFPDSAIGSVTYLWTPGGQITQTAVGLSSGTYIGTATDSIGCAVSDTFTLSFINPVSLTTTTTDAKCYGSCDGTAFIFPHGGTEPYTYIWNTGQTTSSDTALCAGTYYATVTDSNSCAVIDTFTIIQPPKIDLTLSETDATCFGSSDGSATVNASGGTGIFFYLWQPSNQSGSTAVNLAANTYTVTVTDTKGCITDTTITVNSPAEIQINPTITDVTCFGFSDGAINTNVSNGVPPYQYLWLNIGSTGTSSSNLLAGIYPLLVTDANGCIQLDSIEVTQPDVLSGTLEVIPASCPIANDGSIVMNPTGGTLPYFYEWNNDGALTGAGLYAQSAGLNTVVVTDNNGCTFTKSDIIPALPDFIADAGHDTSIELGTRATLRATVNRTGIFQYNWTPGYHLTDSIAAITEAYPYVTTTYMVKITEISSGCNDDDTVTVKILPTEYILFPTAFTPNGDGLNDVFLPISGDLIVMESLKIFNRWGNLVFSDKTRGWDGTFNGLVEEIGTYVYEVTYKVEGRDNLYSKKGSVTLLR
ncbi:MAG TPA: gliding motility-associated C-terminal domain-containing protein [Chitinophagales bacterium]|nr:gliding motility-associated C-terminal domain-containing protein [Chitinophagales bacterium]